MAFFNEFPNTRTYDTDLGWLIATVKKLIDRVDGYNEVHFADPIAWNISTQYDTATIVRDTGSGELYISKQPVPNGILITNTAYWEPLGLGGMQTLCEIINVADYGALGVPGADYTTEIQNAIDDGHILYFPPGEYSFKGVTSSKPLFIFGDGETTIWKPQHRIVTSNQYATMLASASDLTIANINFVGDNSVVSQSGNQYYQSAIVQCTGDSFRMSKCFINDIYDTYHLSQGDLEFFDRNGLLLYVSEAKTAEIDHCTFGNYGGEELIWISRAAARFGEPATIRIHDNTFKNRIMQDNGGLIDGGSAVNVLGGNVYFNNNSANNYYERGSFVNLLGNTVDISNNTIVDCDMSSVFDCCEGYYAKNDVVKVCNNYTNDPNGKTLYSLKAQARELEVIGNHFEGICPIKTYACVDATILADTQYIASGASWTAYDNIRIIDNELLLSEEATQAANSGISIGQSNSAAGSRGTLKYCRIAGNTIKKAKTFTTVFNSVYTVLKIAITEIVGNYIDELGTGVPSGSRKNLVSFAESIASGSKVFVNDNVIEEDSGTAVTVITGSGLANGTYYATGNVLVSSATTKTFIGSAYSGNISGDYNIGFSATAG